MSDIIIPTIEELTRRRMASLTLSEKAILEHPKEYREIKQLIRHIISRPIDISDYYKTARTLGRLLEKMTESGDQSLFHYYYTNIDPTRKGEARYFRANCLDLADQLNCIDEMRHRRRNIRVIH